MHQDPVDWTEEADELLAASMSELMAVTGLIANLVVVLRIGSYRRYAEVLREVEKWKQERSAWL